MKHFWQFLFVFLMISLQVHSQNASKIDSLSYQLEIAKTDSVKISILVSISRLYSSDNLSMAVQYGQKAVDIAESSKSSPLIAHALMNMGFIYFQQGILDLSVKQFYRCIQLYKDTKNAEGEANVLTNIGAIHLQLQNFLEAKEHFTDALNAYNTIYSSKNDTIPPYQLISIYNNLGIVHENLREYSEGIDYYLRGISIASRMNDTKSTLAMLYNNLGSSYMKKGNSREALEAMNEALRIRKSIGDKFGLASSYRMLGIFYSGQGENQKAIQTLKIGLNLANSVGSTPIQVSVYEHLFSLYSKLNQPDSALKYHILYKNLTDQQSKEETLKEISILEMTAQFQEKEKVRELEHKKQQQRIMFATIVLLLFVVILSLLYILSQSRVRRLSLKNKNIELVSRNAELEKDAMAVELELKNKELTTNVMYQIRKNELINSIAEKLMANSHNFKKENQSLIKEIIRELENSQEDSIWKEFETRFHQVHNQFYDKLNNINPDLSPNERRLCAFLRLNMSTKEISSITNQSPRSIEVARTRLRKKLNLTNSDVGLIEHLSSL
jgi:tetratricopeptide (TPR) repeat protein